MSISAVITTYNRSHLLGRAITSILSQSSPVREIIVIDDSYSELHKTRNSAICNSFDCINISYYPNTKNIGVTRSRNLGLAKVSSKFVMFLDDDDEWEADRVELLLQNYSDKYAYITALNLNCTPKGKSYFRRKKVLRLKDILFGNFSGHMPLLKTERLLQLGGFDEKLVSATDWDMWIRLIETFGNALILQVPLYISHIDPHSNSISSSPNKVIGKMRCFQKHESKMPFLARRYVKNEIAKINKAQRCIFTKIYQFPIGLPFVEYLNIFLGPIRYDDK